MRNEKPVSLCSGPSAVCCHESVLLKLSHSINAKPASQHKELVPEMLWPVSFRSCEMSLVCYILSEMCLCVCGGIIRRVIKFKRPTLEQILQLGSTPVKNPTPTSIMQQECTHAHLNKQLVFLQFRSNSVSKVIKI